MKNQTATGSETLRTHLSILDQLAIQSGKVLVLYNVETKQLEFVNQNLRKVWETDEVDIGVEFLVNSIHPEDRHFVEESFREFLRHNTNKQMEFRLHLGTKKVKWVYLEAYHLTLENGQRYMACAVEDITSRKERENTTAKYNARKNAMLEIISHDVKGSLALIKLMNNGIQEASKNVHSPDILRYSNLIEQLCQSNITTIHNLLEAEFLDSAEVRLIRKRLDLVENVQAVFNEYKHSEQLLDRKFTLATKNESAYVEVDEALLTQVFNNLLSNAIKFTPDGGSITISLAEEEERVIVCVTDNGVGIPEHLHAALFDRFTKARRPGINGEQTTGLGMSIVKRIIELHGGEIWVESEEQKGTSIYFYIPKLTEEKPQ